MVGLGIRAGLQLTPETRAAVEAADDVLFLTADAFARSSFQALRPDARSLDALYEPGKDRAAIYGEIVEEILAPVRAGRRTCAAFYGHPGVFAYPGHEAIRRARAEGHEAVMLPAVSTEDCLFADLGVDPAEAGCQSYDATDFLIRRRRVDPSAALVLWQVTVVGIAAAASEPSSAGLSLLVEYLLESYPDDHETVLYEASVLPIARPGIQHVRLRDLPAVPLPRLATLYVPPAERRREDPGVVARLARAVR